MLQTIYIVSLTVGGLYALLSSVFGNLLDLDFDFDFGVVLLPFKPFTLMAFAAVFGGVGLIALSYMPPLMTLLPAIPSGAAVSGGLYYLLFVKLRKLETRTPSVDDALMQRAEVTERIRPGGYGRISYVLGGNTLSGAAKEKIPGGGIDKGRKVYILEVCENTYFVCEDLELYIDHLHKK